MTLSGDASILGVNMDHLDTFGGRIAALRSLVPELAMRELDALAGLHPGHCWQIEKGNRENPTRDTVRPLASVLGVTTGFLLEGERPCIAAHPELDPDNPDHRDAIAAHVCAAVERARAAAAAPPPVGSTHTCNDFTPLATGTEG